jgi:hypothetical protein
VTFAPSSVSFSNRQKTRCAYIRNFLDKGEPSTAHTENWPIWAKEIEFYEVREGVLYRKEIPSSKRKKGRVLIQVVVLISLRPLVMKHLHDDPVADHVAYYRTYMRVNNNYYLPTMREDIQNYCKV